MKKILSVILVLLAVISFFSASTAAASGTASLGGPEAFRAGDTIKISVNINGSGLYAVQGSLMYDANQLSYQSSGDKLSGWNIDIEHNSGKITFLGLDDRLAAPIKSSSRLFSATFKIKSNLAAGTAVKLNLSGLAASDGEQDFSLDGSTYSRNVTPPLSANNKLKSLSAGNVSISPSFSSSTTEYTAVVPYTVKQLQISASAEDAGAKISIAGTSLNVGRNTVAITVTAASGAARKYTITVTRQQDPDYVPGSDARLNTISVVPGILSPEFSAERTDYVVYLPYEITSFTASGEPADSNARGVQSAAIELEQGENLYQLVNVAEDGTEMTYTIMVHRMPEIGFQVSAVTPAPTPEPTPLPTLSPTPTPEPAETTVETTTELIQPEQSPDNLASADSRSWLINLLIISFSFAAGAGLATVWFLKKRT